MSHRFPIFSMDFHRLPPCPLLFLEVIFVSAAPHGELFPQCAVLVHHGGAGTTYSAAGTTWGDPPGDRWEFQDPKNGMWICKDGMWMKYQGFKYHGKDDNP